MPNKNNIVTSLIKDKRNQKVILVAATVIALGVGYWGLSLVRHNSLKSEIELNRLTNSYSLPDPTRTKSCFGDSGIYQKVKNVCYDFVDTMYYVADDDELVDLVAELTPYLNTLSLTSYSKSLLPEEFEEDPYKNVRTITISRPGLRTPDEVRGSIYAQLSVYSNQTKSRSENDYNLATGIQDSALEAIKGKQGYAVVLSLHRYVDK